MRTRRRIGSRLTTVLLIAAFLVFLAPAVGRATGRVRFVPVMSGSMSPALEAGSAAIATSEHIDQVQPGQIIVYTIPVADRHVAVHRVVSVDRTGGGDTVVVTKGDANADNDPWQAKLRGDRVWQVRGSVPILGRAIMWLSSPVVLLICLVGALLAALFLGLRRIWTAPVPAPVEP